MASCKCFRHFRALMRKNFIIYYRTPGCSLFELLAPIILFIGLNIIRNLVPVTPTDPAGMGKKKLPIWPGLANTNGYWENSTDNAAWVDNKVRPLCNYTDYYTRHDSDPMKYNIAWDWEGPQFYAPTQCIRYFDWAKPPKSSPIIAIVGE